MKLVTVLGARPQFIKAAVVSRAIEKFKGEGTPLAEIIVHTGQHYDANMSDVFFEEMAIPHPNHFLKISATTHGAMTGRMIEKIEEVLMSEKPDAVLVYGDTNSTLAGTLAAVKLHIPVAHVEAGLRSFNMRMPEEINRIASDRFSSWLFCPTETAVRNLANEGIVGSGGLAPSAAGGDLLRRVQNVGDVMYDAALYYKELAKPGGKVADLLHSCNGNYILATVHRAENTDNPDRLKSVIESLNRISEETKVILPLHPRTKKFISQLNAGNIEIIEPVGYFDMICLLQNCIAVFTDSGGLQKEAYFFEKPCVTMRDETEWVELVEKRFNILVGADCDKIYDAYRNLSSLNTKYSEKLFGDGRAGEKIISALLKEEAR